MPIKDNESTPDISIFFFRTPPNYIKYSNYGPHYLASLEIFKKYPIFGSGIKTFRTECRDVDIKNYYTTTNLLNNNTTVLLYNNKFFLFHFFLTHLNIT